jgi:drug/metabolite transporter (DMT)-like permease
VSWAAIFIRLADAPSLSISAWRLVLAAVPVALFALLRRREELARLDRRSLGMMALSGVCLALHFATWIASLRYTTVASSVALVTTQPIWVALMGAWFLHESVTRLGQWAIAVTTVGGLLIAGVDLGFSRAAALGDALALAGAVFAGAYFLIGRRVRGTLSAATYVGVVYPVAAGALLAAAVVARAPMTGYSATTWWMLALLAGVAQLLGHSLLNWTLRFFSAPLVSVAILGEPVVSTGLAVPFLHEWPGPLRVAGCAVTLAGVYLAARDEVSRAPAVAPGLVEASE